MYLYVIYYIADIQCCVEGESRIGEVWDWREHERRNGPTLHYGMTTASTINPPAEHPWMNSERCCIPFSRSFYLLFSFLHLYTNTINQTCSWHRNQFYTLVLERLSLKVRYVLWSAPTRVCDPLRAIVSLDRSRVCVRCGDFCFFLNGKHIYTVWIIPCPLYSAIRAIHRTENTNSVN